MKVSQLLGWPVAGIGDVADYVHFPGLVLLSFLQQWPLSLHRLTLQVWLQFQEPMNFYEGKGLGNANVFSKRHLFHAWMQTSKILQSCLLTCTADCL